MEFISTKEASAKWGISVSRIGILLNEGRIPGAQRVGKSWLIPASAAKPSERKAHRSASAKTEPEPAGFSFPLFHYRPDWSGTKEAQLSGQQRSLLLAETAFLECRFADARPPLESILSAPEDIYTEVGALWLFGMCGIVLNRPDDFSRAFLRLQLLLAGDFPHRDDLVIILEVLETYVETVLSAAERASFSTRVHRQALPMTCVLTGYTQMIKEAVKPGTAETSMLELILHFLNSTGADIAVEIIHCYLLGIYSLRQNATEAETHARAIVQLAYETKLYFPLISFYHYNTPVFSPVLEQYPEEFRKLCHDLSSQYEKNYASFLTSISENSVLAKITGTDYPYAFTVLMGLSNTEIAERLGVSLPTVHRRLEKLCIKLGLENKKELRGFLLNHT